MGLITEVVKIQNSQQKLVEVVQLARLHIVLDY